jgi:DNA-binding response OmpR family regulator
MEDSPVDILIAEDDINILLSLEFILKSQNYSVVTAEKGSEALDKIEKLQPRIAILDVMIPEMNGFEISRRVKNESNLDIFIILLTARGSDEDFQKGKEVGADEYLLKPYNPDRLLEIIENVLAK